MSVDLKAQLNRAKEGTWLGKYISIAFMPTLRGRVAMLYNKEYFDWEMAVFGAACCTFCKSGRASFAKWLG